MCATRLELDGRFMARCLELAERARGETSPNPLVGAVVVRDGRIVGEGYHQRCGEPHAERVALEQAGDDAEGATLYTNVEPCCHHGRTPPCTEALIEAGIARLVTSHQDPDPRVDGKGFDALREAGIDVQVGCRADEALELNVGYLQVKAHGRPWVVAKAALSLDARLATSARESQWITGPAARESAHRLRARSDAVMVGVETLLSDDPRLTARVGDEPSPRPRWRVVMDSRLRTPPDCRLLSEGNGEAVVFTTDSAAQSAADALEDAGARVVRVVANDAGRVDLAAAMAGLAAMGATSVLMEGGGELLTEAFDVDIIDEVALFYAPMLIGGSAAPALWNGRGHADLATAPRLTRVRVEPVGDDFLVRGLLHPFAAP